MDHADEVAAERVDDGSNNIEHVNLPLGFERNDSKHDCTASVRKLSRRRAARPCHPMVHQPRLHHECRPPVYGIEPCN